MKWNWQLPKWPQFTFDPGTILELEKTFLLDSGAGFAILQNLDDSQKKEFIVEILSTEGQKSSEIEGELLERDGLRSTIQRHLDIKTRGLSTTKERSMAGLLWDMCQNYDEPLTHKMLRYWHKTLMEGDRRASEIGKYRTHEGPMQISSDRHGKRKIFFEAPPSKFVHKEMDKFIKWFNSSKEESVLVRAAITHVYFESIHPFEDGNGRIGRALVEKALSQSLEKPLLIAVSQGISRRIKDYYKSLASCNNTLDIQTWIEFFADVIIQSQKESLSLIYFLAEKSKLMSLLQKKLNPRQEKALLRIFSDGITGFIGGISAENYIKITKTSHATATRDLNDLVEKGALFKTGKLKHSRYQLNVSQALG